MVKKRIEYLDAIKGFSILLVVFCHNVLLPAESIIGNIAMALAWVAVPLFMMVSGYLMNNAKTFSWKKHLTRIGKIYITLSVWKLICLIVGVIIFEVSFSKVQLINYLFFFGNIDGVVSVAWYMEALMMSLLLHPVTYFLVNGGKKGKQIFNFVVILLFVCGFGKMIADFFFLLLEKISGISGFDLSRLYNVVPFWSYSNIMFFFLLGTFLKINEEYINKIPEKVRKVLPHVFVVLGVCGLVIVKYVLTGSIQWNGIYISFGYQRFSTIILAIGMWYVFFNKENFIVHLLAKFFGQYTQGIYYIHLIVLYVCEACIYQYLWPYASFGLNLLKMIIVAVISAVITKIITYIPLVKQLVK